MTLATFQEMVIAMGITANTWTSDSELYTINMANDGTHHYVPGQQDLYFDTTRGIVKIKYYKEAKTDTSPYTNNLADVFLFCEGITGFTMKKFGPK
jgi:hypothetical protein